MTLTAEQQSKRTKGKMKTAIRLTDEQARAAHCEDPKVLCVAGPGSGKTETLINRILFLMSRGQSPRGMAVVTFTNAAARQLEERLYSHFDWPMDADGLGFVGTLHAFMMKLLQEHGSRIGLSGKLSVIDDDQKASLLETIAEELGIKKFDSKKAEKELKASARESFVNPTKRELVLVEYFKRLRSSGLLDFDTILEWGRELIERMKHEPGWPWQCLFVDEYQDSATVDAFIYSTLPANYKFIVGDPDQAIYGFRGGDVSNIIEMANPGTGGRIYKFTKLETNHRSGSHICKAAQRVISHNMNRVDKAMIVGRPDDNSEALVQMCNNAADEMCFVLDKITELANSAGTVGTNPYADIAVIARTNKLVETFTEFLSSRGIPVVKKKAIVNPADWRKAKLLISLLINPWNDLTAHQYLVEKLGRAEANKIKNDSAIHMKSINDDTLKFVQGADLMATLVRENISKESQQRVRDAIEAIEERDGGDPAFFTVSLTDLLMFLSLGEEQQQEQGSGVVVTTMHSAKGREWGTVFIVGAEEQIIPGERKEPNYEEERRVFYVAMTRAKDRLIISHVRVRSAPFGPQVLREHQPSRYLLEAQA